MALEFAHGAVRWLTADAVSTVYTISGLPFQPKALRFYIFGHPGATDTTSSTHLRQCVGFAVSTSSRRAVATYDQHVAGTMTCGSGYRDDCIALTVDGSPAVTGRLDLNSITSDGFTLIVDDQAPADVNVFWEAWGGDDITVATVVDIAEPAATGDVDYTVTGFTSGATDQVVMFAGTQTTSASPAADGVDGGFCVGAASGPDAANNIVMAGNQDDGSPSADTDRYIRDGECLAMISLGGGNPDARAQLTQFGTDNFRLNWIARATTNRRYIALAIKGGSWAVGSTTINATSASATATVSGLPFEPIGVSLMSGLSTEDAAGTSSVEDKKSMGSGSSTSSRRALGHWDENGPTAADVNLSVEYDGILAVPTAAAAIDCVIDLSQMNSDGFQLIVDDAGASVSSSSWIGYLTFGSQPAAAPAPNVNDSVGETDDVTVRMVIPVSAVDTDTAAEALDIQRNPLLAEVFDDDLAAEAIAVTVNPLVPVVFDDTPATEDVRVHIPIPVLAVDDDVASELVLVTVNPLFVVVDDTVAITEAVDIQRNPLLIDVNDVDALTDVAEVSLPVIVDVADTGAPAEFIDIQRNPLLAVVFDDTTAAEDVRVHIPIPVLAVDDDIASEVVAVTVNPLVPVVFDDTLASEFVQVHIPIPVLAVDDDSAAEVVAVTVNPLVPVVFDDTPVGEFVAVAIPMSVVVFDDTPASESVTIERNPLLVDVFDDTPATDVVSVRIPINVVVFDDVVATEAVAVVLNPIHVLAADDAPASELVNLLFNPLLVDVFDADTPGESINILTSGSVAVQVADVGSPAEAVTVSIPMAASVFDGLAAADVPLVLLNPILVVVDDVLGVTENVTLEFSSAVLVVVADDVPSAETVSIALPLPVMAVDAVPAVEAVLITLNPVQVVVVDDVGVIEALAVVLAGGDLPLIISAVDALSVTERRSVLHVLPEDLVFGQASVRQAMFVNQAVEA